MTERLGSAGQPEFEKPLDVLIWASRVYLHNFLNGQPVHDSAQMLFHSANLDAAYEALIRALAIMSSSADEDLVVHEPACPKVSFHEQSFFTAIQYLKRKDELAYTASLAAILPPSAIRLLRGDLEIVASGLLYMEQSWPNFLCMQWEDASTFDRSKIGLHLFH